MALGDNEMNSDDEFLDGSWDLDLNDDRSEDDVEIDLSYVLWSTTPPIQRWLENSVNYHALKFIGPDPGPTRNVS